MTQEIYFDFIPVETYLTSVITVGAYDSRLNTYADFSGRGGQNLSFPKPDLVAPGVNITAPTPGGAYTTVAGTSFSTPFVTGSAALLMEWGLIQRNDPFLWGEKVKAYLRRGAQPLPGFNEYPNEDFLSPGSVPFILGSIYMHNTPDAAESNK